MNKVFLICRVYRDGDGNDCLEPLTVYSNYENAELYCLKDFASLYKKRLFNSDGSKKLFKLPGHIIDGKEYFRMVEQPSIYYDYYYMCVNQPERFAELYIRTGKEYVINEYIVHE